MNTAEQRMSDRSVDRFYIGYLEESLLVIERAMQALEAGESLDPSVFRAEVVAHKIKGNAALYDLPELGKISGNLEGLLKERAAASTIAEAMSGFMEAIGNIIDTGDIQASIPPAPVSFQQEATAQAVSKPALHAYAEKSILLVFENPWFAKALSDYLNGAEVHLAHSCGEAISWLSKQVPDIIVCESDLPDTPGIEFMEFVRGNGRFQNLPFLLAFPGSASFDEISEAIAAGASAFVENSGNVQKLAESIHDIFSSENKLILIIDDDEPVRDLLKQTFETEGYAVDTAVDGIDALLKIKARQPSAIILDRNMPRMGGEATLRELQALASLGTVPIIVLTAMDNAGEASKWLMRGASEFIAKPFDPDEVLARVKRLMKTGRADRL